MSRELVAARRAHELTGSCWESCPGPRRRRRESSWRQRPGRTWRRIAYLFESFILPLSIIATIPLAAIGVGWIHYALGYNLDFLGWWGSSSSSASS